MGKLKEINGYVRLALDKLKGIRTDLVRTDVLEGLEISTVS